MPLYESEKLTHDEMQKQARRKKCQCGGSLLVAWSADHNSYMLRCGNNLEHDEFVRPVSTSNYDLPGYNMPGVMRRKEKELVTKYGEEATKALVRAGGGNALSTLTEAAARSMAEVLWPEAIKTPSGKNAITKLALICRDYGLNPAMDHVFLVPFNRKDKQGNIIGTEWSVVRGIKASRLICGRDKSYGYIDDTPRIMTRDEQLRVFGEVDEDSIVAICKLKDRDGNIFTGYGKWPKFKTYSNGNKYPNDPQGTDKGNSKFNMACIRAERQALDKLNPGFMPAIDVVDENYVQHPKVVVTEDGTKVDANSGEIQEEPEAIRAESVEGEFTEQEPDTESEPPKKKFKDPSEIKSFGDLYKVCMDQWPNTFKSSKDVLREVGVSSQVDVSQTPSEVYATILYTRS